MKAPRELLRRRDVRAVDRDERPKQDKEQERDHATKDAKPAVAEVVVAPGKQHVSAELVPAMHRERLAQRAEHDRDVVAKQLALIPPFVDRPLPRLPARTFVAPIRPMPRPAIATPRPIAVGTRPNELVPAKPLAPLARPPAELKAPVAPALVPVEPEVEGAAPAGGGGGGGGPMPEQEQKQVPKELVSQGQAAIEAHVAKAKADRKAAKERVAAQKLAKATRIAIDGKTIAATAQRRNDQKLAGARAEAAQAKREAEARARAEAEKHAGEPVTLASLTEKLETTAREERAELDRTFAEKTRELRAKIETQREQLHREITTQVDNVKKEREDKQRQVEAAWTKEKRELEVKSLKLQSDARIAYQKDASELIKRTNDLAAAAKRRAGQARVDAAGAHTIVIAKGQEHATAAHREAMALSATEKARGTQIADAVIQMAETNALASPDNAMSIKAQGFLDAAKAAEPFLKRAKDMAIQADLSYKTAVEVSIAEARAMFDAAMKDAAALEQTGAAALGGLETKLGQIFTVGQAKVAKVGEDLAAKLAEGQAALGKQLAGFTEAIAKIEADGKVKLGKIETDATKQLETDYQAAVKQLDARIATARKQLAAAKPGSEAQMAAMVDRACKDIDRQVAATETKFDAAIASAEKRAQDAVLAQLKLVEREAETALAAIDANFERAMAELDAAVERAHDAVEQTARGKTLEIEVHVATILSETGQGARLTAVKKQLAWYVENKLPVPEGYGETPPAPPSKKDGLKDAMSDAAAEGVKALEGKASGVIDGLFGSTKSDGVLVREGATPADIEAEKKREAERPLSKAEIDDGVAQLLKRGQTQTVTGRAAANEQRLVEGKATAFAAMDKTREADKVLQQKVLAGDEEALKAVNRVRADTAIGEEGADELQQILRDQKKAKQASPDPKRILGALEGKTKEQIAAMRRSLAELDPPVDLDDLIAKQMAGPDQKQARAHLQGDEIMADIIGLEANKGHELTGNEKLVKKGLGIVAGPGALLLDKATGDGNIGEDDDRIREILAKYKGDPDKLAEFARRYEERTGRSLGHFIDQTIGEKAKEELARTVPEEKALELGLRPDTRTTEAKKEEGKRRAEAAVAMYGATKVDPKAMRPTVRSLKIAFGSMSTDGARAKAVKEALANLSQEQMAYVRAAYLAETGRELDREIESAFTGGERTEVSFAASADPAKIAVGKLIGAADSGLTDWAIDDKRMQDALKELKDPRERTAALAEFERLTGRKLEDVIAEKMTGRDEDLAVALMEGDELKVQMLTVDEATNGGFMNNVYAGIAERTSIPEEYLRAVAPLGFLGDTKIDIGGYELSAGGVGKIDSDQLFATLEECKDPQQRAALAQLYKQRTGRDLDDDMKKKLVGPSGDQSKLDAYEELMEHGATPAYRAARMDDAVSGLNDAAGFHKQLEGKTDKERKDIIAAFEKRYPDKSSAFLEVVEAEFGGDSLDAQKAKLLAFSEVDATTGFVKLPDEFVLRYAQDSVWNRAAKQIDSATAFVEKYPALAFVVGPAAKMQAENASFLIRGWGVDNEQIKKTLAGKSKAEIDELVKKYPELKKDLAYALSGRDAYEVDLMLTDGEPKTPEERAQRALKMYAFDRGPEGAWIKGIGLEKVSNAIVDTFSPAGQFYDRDAAELTSLLEAAKGKLSPEQEKQFDAALKLMTSSTSNYLAAREEITGVITTVVGTVVGAVVTVVTGGAAAPIIAAMLSGASTMVIKSVMLGRAYGRNDMSVDLAMTAVQAATAGLGGAFTKEGAGFMAQVLEGSIGEAASRFVETAITSKDAHDLAGLLAQASKAGLVGLLAGGAQTVAQAKLGAAIEALNAKSFGSGAPLVGVATKGFLTGGAGSVAAVFAEAVVDPSVLSGDWDAVALKLGRSFVEGGFDNAVGESGESIGDRRRAAVDAAVAAAKKARDDGGTLDDQHAAFAESLADADRAAARDDAAAATANDANAKPEPGDTSSQDSAAPHGDSGVVVMPVIAVPGSTTPMPAKPLPDKLPTPRADDDAPDTVRDPLAAEKAKRAHEAMQAESDAAPDTVRADDDAPVTERDPKQHDAEGDADLAPETVRSATDDFETAPTSVDATRTPDVIAAGGPQTPSELFTTPRAIALDPEAFSSAIDAIKRGEATSEHIETIVQSAVALAIEGWATSSRMPLDKLTSADLGGACGVGQGILVNTLKTVLGTDYGKLQIRQHASYTDGSTVTGSKWESATNHFFTTIGVPNGPQFIVDFSFPQFLDGENLPIGDRFFATPEGRRIAIELNEHGYVALPSDDEGRTANAYGRALTGKDERFTAADYATESAAKRHEDSKLLASTVADLAAHYTPSASAPTRDNATPSHVDALALSQAIDVVKLGRATPATIEALASVAQDMARDGHGAAAIADAMRAALGRDATRLELRVDGDGLVISIPDLASTRAALEPGAPNGRRGPLPGEHYTQGDIVTRFDELRAAHPDMPESDAARQARHDVIYGIDDAEPSPRALATISILDAARDPSPSRIAEALAALGGITKLSDRRHLMQEMERGGMPFAKAIAILPADAAHAITKHLDDLRISDGDRARIDQELAAHEALSAECRALEAATQTRLLTDEEMARFDQLLPARQALMDSITDAYGIDDSRVTQRDASARMGYSMLRGSITPIRHGIASDAPVAVALPNGRVASAAGAHNLFFHPDGSSRSHGDIAAILGHEVEVHVAQLREGRYSVIANDGTVDVATAINEVEAYGYMIAQAKRFGLTETELAYWTERHAEHLAIVQAHDPAAHARLLANDFGVGDVPVIDAAHSAWTLDGLSTRSDPTPAGDVIGKLVAHDPGGRATWALSDADLAKITDPTERALAAELNERAPHELVELARLAHAHSKIGASTAPGSPQHMLLRFAATPSPKRFLEWASSYANAMQAQHQGQQREIELRSEVSALLGETVDAAVMQVGALRRQIDIKIVCRNGKLALVEIKSGESSLTTKPRQSGGASRGSSSHSNATAIALGHEQAKDGTVDRVMWAFDHPGTSGPLLAAALYPDDSAFQVLQVSDGDPQRIQQRLVIALVTRHGMSRADARDLVARRIADGRLVFVDDKSVMARAIVGAIRDELTTPPRPARADEA